MSLTHASPDAVSPSSGQAPSKPRPRARQHQRPRNHRRGIKAARPPGGMHLYVIDALGDPYAAQTQMADGFQLIAASRRKANKVNAKADVTVR